MMPLPSRMMSWKYSRAQRGVRGHQAEPHHQEADHHHGEDFEHAFYPEVDQPPAPVVGHGDVAVFADEQREAVEHRDRRGGVEQQVSEAAAVGFRFQRAAQAAGHDEQPDPHARDQQDTSTAGRVPGIPSPACRATTSVRRACPSMREYSPVEAADNHNHQRAEQDVDERPLSLRLACR